MNRKTQVDRGNRIEYLDIAKGICIILMVCSHAHIPYRSYITHFHMPFFFFVSGFLFNETDTIKDFFLKKFTTLYIPFVFWNVVTYIIKFFGDLDGEKFLSFLIKVALTWTKENKFMGPTWFLGALFAESVIYKVIDKIVKPFPFKRWVILGFYVLRAAFAFEYTLPHKLSRTLILGMFFVIGHLAKENIEKIRRFDTHVVAWVGFIVYVLVGHFVIADVSNNEYSSPFWFVVGALCGLYFVIYISRQATRFEWKWIRLLRNMCCTISRRSIDILIWHKLCFTPIILLQLFLLGKPLEQWVKRFPVYIHEDGWWFVYVVVGISLSILWTNLLKTGAWGKLLKKMHVI